MRSPGNSDESAPQAASATTTDTLFIPAYRDGSDESRTIADEGVDSVDVMTLVGPSDVPAALHDPIPTSAVGDVDWSRLHALVMAVEALVGAGMSEEARPLVAQVRAILEAARGPDARVVLLSAERAKRG